MSAYSKFVAAIAGNIVAILIVFAASKGLATCGLAGDPNTCTIFGFTTAQITGAVLSLVNMAFVYLAPANTPA